MYFYITLHKGNIYFCSALQSYAQKTSLEKSPTMTVTEHIFKMRILRRSTTCPQLIHLCLTVKPLKPDPRLVQYLERATDNKEPVSLVEMKRHSNPTLIFLSYSTGTIEYSWGLLSMYRKNKL